jgi:hypothetical protein
MIKLKGTINKLTRAAQQRAVDELLELGDVGVLRLIAHAKFAWAQGRHKVTTASIRRLLKKHPAVMARVLEAVNADPRGPACNATKLGDGRDYTNCDIRHIIMDVVNGKISTGKAVEKVRHLFQGETGPLKSYELDLKCDLERILECLQRTYVPHDPATEGLCLAIRGMKGIIKKLEK